MVAKFALQQLIVKRSSSIGLESVNSSYKAACCQKLLLNWVRVCKLIFLATFFSLIIALVCCVKVVD